MSLWVIQAESECLSGYLLLSHENASLTLIISVFSRNIQERDIIVTHLLLEFTCKVCRPACDKTYRLAQYADVRTKFVVMRAPPQRSTAVPFAKMAT